MLFATLTMLKVGVHYVVIGVGGGVGEGTVQDQVFNNFSVHTPQE